MIETDEERAARLANYEGRPDHKLGWTTLLLASAIGLILWLAIAYAIVSMVL